MESYELVPFPLPGGGRCSLLLHNKRIFAKDFILPRRHYHFTYPSRDLSDLVLDLRLTQDALRVVPELREYSSQLGEVRLSEPVIIAGPGIYRTALTHQDLYALLQSGGDLYLDAYNQLRLVL